MKKKWKDLLAKLDSASRQSKDALFDMFAIVHELLEHPDEWSPELIQGGEAADKYLRKRYFGFLPPGNFKALLQCYETFPDKKIWEDCNFEFAKLVALRHEEVGEETVLSKRNTQSWKERALQAEEDLRRLREEHETLLADHDAVKQELSTLREKFREIELENSRLKGQIDGISGASKVA